MNLKRISIVLLAGILALYAPETTRAQATFPVEEATIQDIEAAYMSGRTTARVVAQSHLDRIAAYDKRGPLINSLITINPKAIEEAQALDAKLAAAKGKIPGPLFGIPVIVKDNLDAVGIDRKSVV